MTVKDWVIAIQRRSGLLKTFELNGIKINIEHLSKTLKYYITKGGYEEEERRLCVKYFTKEDRVMEFGSSIGYLSLYCKKIIGIQQILCVEPNPAALRELKRNFELNGEALNVLPVCLAARDADITFHANDDLWESSFLPKGESKQINSISVRGARLQSILNETGFNPTAMILDIEGGESVVDFKEVSKSVNKIVMELHPAQIGVPDTYRVLNDLMNLGFQVQQKMGNCYALLRQ